MYALLRIESGSGKCSSAFADPGFLPTEDIRSDHPLPLPESGAGSAQGRCRELPVWTAAGRSDTTRLNLLNPRSAIRKRPAESPGTAAGRENLSYVGFKSSTQNYDGMQEVTCVASWLKWSDHSGTPHCCRPDTLSSAIYLQTGKEPEVRQG